MPCICCIWVVTVAIWGMSSTGIGWKLPDEYSGGKFMAGEMACAICIITDVNMDIIWSSHSASSFKCLSSLYLPFTSTFCIKFHQIFHYVWGASPFTFEPCQYKQYGYMCDVTYSSPCLFGCCSSTSSASTWLLVAVLALAAVIVLVVTFVYSVEAVVPVPIKHIWNYSTVNYMVPKSC